MIAPEPKPLWSEFDLLSCSFALPPGNGRHNRVTDLIFFLISTMSFKTWITLSPEVVVVVELKVDEEAEAPKGR